MRHVGNVFVRRRSDALDAHLPRRDLPDIADPAARTAVDVGERGARPREFLRPRERTIQDQVGTADRQHVGIGSRVCDVGLAQRSAECLEFKDRPVATVAGRREQGDLLGRAAGDLGQRGVHRSHFLRVENRFTRRSSEQTYDLGHPVRHGEGGRRMRRLIVGDVGKQGGEFAERAGFAKPHPDRRAGRGAIDALHIEVRLGGGAFR